ncbi:LacI family DNA-binding transcriptional regulator [Aneurinibacillus terranovensis]|uniref:LacI family DNA-binding transcriptional regulator n=1 Tax=Aneurinibacillus terranovensis TaxID=278991 RepID=UPI00041CE117|nr:LacI family DNA-binding transcriptional regulator [Aneurinibacillus terranovensis]
MKPTIYDVAREAEVSIATVSKVINNTGRISDKTRKKVMDVMDRLGYRPSIVASALTGKRTYTIGLLIPDLANPFFAEIARSVENRGHELGFSIVLCSTDNDSNKEAKYIALLRQKSVDGIILAAGFNNDEILKQLVDEKFPIAVISQDIPSLAADSVTVDDYLGGYKVTEHLISLGHKRIAVFAENARSSKERIRGYRQALTDAGLDLDERFIYVCDSTIEGGKQQAREMLTITERPTAIFACNDLLAVGVMQAAREYGLTFPDDLSIIGFDNTILATSVNPPLTSVAQPIEEMGRQVMDLLVQRIEGATNMKRRVVLLPEMIYRGSTKPPVIH